MPFDKLGKSIKESNQLTTPYYENDDYPRKIISKLSRLSTGVKTVFCRWLKYGFMESVQAEALPTGTIIITDWSSEVDSLVHELINNGIAFLND
ncbi:MAG: hypothetical protein ACP5GY_09745, partial [Vulcanisaeta sp.]